MSIDIMNRLWWRDDLATMEKFVGIALGDSANDSGVCWPAIDTIALKCSCSRRTVQNAIKGLEGRRILRIVHRHDRSSYYVFQFEHIPHVERVRPEKEVGPADIEIRGAGAAPHAEGRGASGSFRGASGSIRGAGAAPRTVIEPSVEPPFPPNPPRGEGEDADLFGCEAVAKAFPAEDLEQHLAALWTAARADIPRWPEPLPLKPAQRADLMRRVKEHAQSSKPEDARACVEALVRTASESRFLRGDRTDFHASIPWLLGKKNFAKVMNGFYDTDAAAGAAQFSNPDRSFVAAGRAALDAMRARGGETRRSVRDLARGH